MTSLGDEVFHMFGSVKPSFVKDENLYSILDNMNIEMILIV